MWGAYTCRLMEAIQQRLRIPIPLCFSGSPHLNFLLVVRGVVNHHVLLKFVGWSRE